MANQNYLNEKPESMFIRGWEDLVPLWLTSFNHKRIAVMYLIAIFAVLTLGTLLQFLYRLGLFIDVDALKTLGASSLYNWHNALFVIIVLVPAIPCVLGNYLLPSMVGAKDMQLPVLNFAAFHSFMGGTTVLILSLLLGGADNLWNNSQGLSLNGFGISLGAFLIGQTLILNSLNFILTIHLSRDEKIPLSKLPIFAWSLYANSILQLLAAPLLVLPMVFGLLDLFSGSQLSDPALTQQFSWIFSTSALGLTLIPAVGLIAEILPVIMRKKLFGYSSMVFSFFLVVVIKNCEWFLSFFTVPGTEFYFLSTSAFSALLTMPAVIWGICLVGTFVGGENRLNGVYIWLLCTITTMFTATIVNGFYLLPPLRSYFEGTFFEVGANKFIWLGVVISSFLTGLHYWWPKMFGKKLPDASIDSGAVFYFTSLFTYLIACIVLGIKGLPAGFDTVAKEYEMLLLYVMVGAGLLFISYINIALGFIGSLKSDEKAEDNPYESLSPEWSLSTPPMLDETPSLKDLQAEGFYSYKPSLNND